MGNDIDRCHRPDRPIKIKGQRNEQCKNRRGKCFCRKQPVSTFRTQGKNICKHLIPRTLSVATALRQFVKQLLHDIKSGRKIFGVDIGREFVADIGKNDLDLGGFVFTCCR